MWIASKQRISEIGEVMWMVRLKRTHKVPEEVYDVKTIGKATIDVEKCETNR